MGGQSEGMPGVAGAALAQQAVQPGARSRRHRREGGEARVVRAVARHHGQGDVTAAALGSDLFDAVAPVFEAAEQADHHAARGPDELLDEQVHRQGVAQPGEIGEAQAGQIRILPGRGQGAEIAVGEREEHEVSRRQPQVRGRLRLVERASLADQQMHARLRPAAGRGLRCLGRW